MEDEIKRNKFILSIMIVSCGFIFSQDFIWELLRPIAGNEFVEKFSLVFQLVATAYYTFFIIYGTDDKNILSDCLKKNKMLKNIIWKCLEMFHCNIWLPITNKISSYGGDITRTNDSNVTHIMMFFELLSFMTVCLCVVVGFMGLISLSSMKYIEIFLQIVVFALNGIGVLFVLKNIKNKIYNQ